MKSHELRIERFIRTVELCKGQLELLYIHDLDGRGSIPRALKSLITDLSRDFFPEKGEETLDEVMQALDLHFNGECEDPRYPHHEEPDSWGEKVPPEPEGPFCGWAWFYAPPETEDEAARLVEEPSPRGPSHLTVERD